MSLGRTAALGKAALGKMELGRAIFIAHLRQTGAFEADGQGTFTLEGIVESGTGPGPGGPGGGPGPGGPNNPNAAFEADGRATAHFVSTNYFIRAFEADGQGAVRFEGTLNGGSLSPGHFEANFRATGMGQAVFAAAYLIAARCVAGGVSVGSPHLADPATVGVLQDLPTAYT